jgi:DNA polymerase-3 subunit alpha
MPFVHLHLHTEYSLVDSVVRIDELMAAAKKNGMPAVAMTDQGNLFAMVKFYKAAQAAGILPIIGCDLLVHEEGERAEPSSLVLLCQSEAGYKNLSRLVTRAYLHGQRNGTPTIDRSWLAKESLEGLIALSGGRHGDVGRALLQGEKTLAGQHLNYWTALFGDRYYLELQRTGRPGEDIYIEGAVELAAVRDVPVVATNDVRFLSPEEFETHEARVAIQESVLLDDPSRPRRYADQQYLKSPEEMAELFSDLPEAIENAVQIAKRCSVELKLGKSVLPSFPVPAGVTIEDFLRQEAYRTLTERLPRLLNVQAGERVIPESEYRERLAIELNVITKMGFSGYFLVVADFIRWAKDNDVPVGPGRGSGAGSLVAYALGITDLDPLRYDLLFERFLNPERVSMPDFDVDFCMQGRDRVIDYVAKKYGRNKVSQIITYGTMSAKAVVRDSARVLGMSPGFADSIAKLVPFEVGITLKDAMEKEEELKRRYETEEETRDVLNLALSLEGLARNAGMHAGGVVIAPTELTDFTPLFADESGESVVTQLDKDDVEAAGLVKFDFLGLRTLTIIDWAVKIVNAQKTSKGEAAIDISMLPLNDAATFQTLKDVSTTAVFQLESRGMKDLVRKLQPDCFEDIVALVALFRPGPLQSGMVDDFIARKHDTTGAAIDYLHPKLTDALKPTYGVILYQEQVMQIAQVLAGYTLGGADLLRRAMGKKKPEEMAKQREIFVKGATERGVEEATATHIFDLMEKFAGYGFNKSHSAAYALLSYQTAWLKTHHTSAFMAAALSSEIDKTDKLVPLIDEVRRLGIVLQTPDVNLSQYLFTVSGDNSIRYGLGAIKSVGEPVVAMIIKEREANGPYRDIEDLCRRTDHSKVNRRVLEQLIRSGALDSIGPNRPTLLEALPEALKFAEQSSRAADVGQQDLFGGSASTALPIANLRTVLVPEWTARVKLEAEYDSLGLYLTGHPFHEFEGELETVVSGKLSDLMASKPDTSNPDAARFGKPGTIAGMVLDIMKRNERVIFIVDDHSARIEVSIFEEQFLPFKDVLSKGAIVVVDGNLRFDDYIDGYRFNAKKITSIDEVRAAHATKLMIRTPKDMTPEFSASLKKVLEPHVGGNCPISVKFQTKTASAELALPEKWSVKLSVELTESIQQLVGVGNVRVQLNRPRHQGFQSRQQYQQRGSQAHPQRPAGRLERAMTQDDQVPTAPTAPPPAPASLAPTAKPSAASVKSVAAEPETSFAPAI